MYEGRVRVEFPFGEKKRPVSARVREAGVGRSRRRWRHGFRPGAPDGHSRRARAHAPAASAQQWRRGEEHTESPSQVRRVVGLPIGIMRKKGGCKRGKRQGGKGGKGGNLSHN